MGAWLAAATVMSGTGFGSQGFYRNIVAQLGAQLHEFAS
jgi:hypothetical protein